jgi:hypothetical protein
MKWRNEVYRNITFVNWNSWVLQHLLQYHATEVKREMSNEVDSQPPTTFLTPFSMSLKVRSRRVSVNI